MTTETQNKKKTVQEMRSELTALGYTSDELDLLSKKQLREQLESVHSTQNLFEDIVVEHAITSPPAEILAVDEELPKEVVEDDAIDVEVTTLEEEDKIQPTDTGWTDYVLSLFDKDREMENDNPRVDGLRRVAEKLYGRFSIHSNVIEAPSIQNAGRATVMTQLRFLENEYQDWVVEGCADVFSGNTKSPYSYHATATAETRSEGRALRKALKLTKVLAAEETYNADVDEPNGNDKRIPTTMLNSLFVMSQRLGVDLLRTAQKFDFKIDSTDQLTKEQGLEIAKILGKFESKEIEIPFEVNI